MVCGWISHWGLQRTNQYRDRYCAYLQKSYQIWVLCDKKCKRGSFYISNLNLSHEATIIQVVAHTGMCLPNATWRWFSYELFPPGAPVPDSTVAALPPRRYGEISCCGCRSQTIGHQLSIILQPLNRVRGGIRGIHQAGRESCLYTNCKFTKCSWYNIIMNNFCEANKSFILPQPANHLFIKINPLHNICTKISHTCCGFMPVSLHHSARSLKISTGNEVIDKFHIPADEKNVFGNGVPALAAVYFI